MFLAVTVLLLQFPLISGVHAVPAAVPASAVAVASAEAREAKSPDTPMNDGLSATLTPDLNSVHYENRTVSTTESNLTAPLYSTPRSSAENLPAFSSIRIATVEPNKNNGIIRAERPSRRSWLALSLVQHGAAAFDAYTTRQAISRGAMEADPTMRPFANSPGLYAVIQIGPVVLDMVARRMQRSQNGFIRHIWWLPQSVSTAAFLYSGAHNLNVAGHP